MDELHAVAHYNIDNVGAIHCNTNDVANQRPLCSIGDVANNHSERMSATIVAAPAEPDGTVVAATSCMLHLQHPSSDGETASAEPLQQMVAVDASLIATPMFPTIPDGIIQFAKPWRNHGEGYMMDVETSHM